MTKITRTMVSCLLALSFTGTAYAQEASEAKAATDQKKQQEQEKVVDKKVEDAKHAKQKDLKKKKKEAEKAKKKAKKAQEKLAREKQRAVEKAAREKRKNSARATFSMKSEESVDNGTVVSATFRVVNADLSPEGTASAYLTLEDARGNLLINEECTADISARKTKAKTKESVVSCSINGKGTFTATAKWLDAGGCEYTGGGMLTTSSHSIDRLVGAGMISLGSRKDAKVCLKGKKLTKSVKKALPTGG